MNKCRWFEIWNKRTPPEVEDVLEGMIYADGFDSGAGKIETDSWRDYVDFISKKIKIRKEDTIFEVGCGSGAFLFLFYQGGHKVGGIDYSEPLIRMASDAMKSMDFRVCEASDIDPHEKYDFVISNSVFHYFPDREYAEYVIQKMLKKARKAVAVLEVPDLKLKEEAERVRRAALSEGEYERKYEGLNHLYYDRDWFYHVCNKVNCRVTIFDQNITRYGNNKFRFNCLLEKEATNGRGRQRVIL